ncbi:M23 family metallopeptidase [Sphingomonas sp. LHG3443-2]|uniref:M23 family metallopeptidase n=1 Tax=Sphingomonas sp. LHG3443-2 TaxID=2804639 RepID=UPI003CF7F4C7
MHGGLDLPAAWGTTVRAASSGIVRRAGWAGGYGNLIEIAHLDGTSTRYGHLSSILVQTGERVSAGQRIGGVGSTGRSTGPHLHFEIRRNGAPVNPLGVPTSFTGDQFVTTWSTQPHVDERSGWVSAGGDVLPSMQLKMPSTRAH